MFMWFLESVLVDLVTGVSDACTQLNVKTKRGDSH